MREPNVPYKFRHNYLHVMDRFQKTNPKELDTGIDLLDLYYSVLMWKWECPKKEGRKESTPWAKLRKRVWNHKRQKYAEATYTIVHILGVDLIFRKCNGKYL